MPDFEIAPAALRALLEGGEEVVLLDVREAEEYREGVIPGSVSIPMGDVPARAVELDEEARIVVFCRHGQRSAMVAQFLLERSFERVQSLRGGFTAWADGGGSAAD